MGKPGEGWEGVMVLLAVWTATGSSWGRGVRGVGIIS